MSRGVTQLVCGPLLALAGGAAAFAPLWHGYSVLAVHRICSSGEGMIWQAASATAASDCTAAAVVWWMAGAAILAAVALTAWGTFLELRQPAAPAPGPCTNCGAPYVVHVPFNGWCPRRI